MTAVSPGKATITATCGEVSASAIVTVSAQPDKIISVGGKVTLKTAKKVAKVEVSDEAVVTAKAKKKKVVVKGVAPGTANVWAYDKKGKVISEWVIKVTADS